MKSRNSLALGTAIAVILALSSPTSPTQAQITRAQPTAPGNVSGTGQINPGVSPQPPSQSTDFAVMPTPEEARAALMEPISKQPSTGDASAATTGTGTQGTQAGANTTPTTGEPPPSGPIGSFGQTLPAKFSKRNDILDHLPTMAWPLSLTDDQRKQIYDAVMADKSAPVAGADALKPASELSPDQALNGMRPLPDSVSNIDGAKGLYYLKAKDKALLIDGPTRTMVAEIKG
jgi:hypothetical protein